MNAKILLVALLLLAAPLQAGNDEPKLAERLLLLIGKLDPELPVPRDPELVDARYSVKQSPVSFQLIAEGDHFDALSRFFRSAGGDPLLEKDHESGRRDAVFNGRSLRYAVTYIPEERQTVVFGLPVKK